MDVEKTTIQVEAHPAFAALLRTVEQQAEVIETQTKRGDLLAASSLGQRLGGGGGFWSLGFAALVEN